MDFDDEVLDLGQGRRRAPSSGIEMLMLVVVLLGVLWAMSSWAGRREAECLKATCETPGMARKVVEGTCFCVGEKKNARP